MAARTISADARKRLGRLLTERRIQVNPAYRNRQRFVDERGLNYRLVSDIEKARRVDFSDSTLIALELAYGWATGSISDVLEGRDPEVLETVPPPHPDPEPEPEPEDPAVAHLLRTPGASDRERRALVEVWHALGSAGHAAERYGT